MESPPPEHDPSTFPGLRDASRPVPQEADVVVVGAGVVGLATARELAVGGTRVVVVDRGTAGLGASFGNGGLVPPSHSIPLSTPATIRKAIPWMLDPESPFYIRPRLDPRLIAFLVRFAAASRADHVRRAIPAMRDLNRLSVERLRAVAGDLGGVGYRVDGLLNVYRTTAGFAAGQRDAAILADHGLSSRTLSGAETRAQEPALTGAIAGGVLWPQDGSVDPVRLTAALVADLRRRDVPVVEGIEVLELHTNGARREVRTAAGTIRVNAVVLAGGSSSVRLLCRQTGTVPVQPAKGYSVTIRNPAVRLRRPLLLVESKVAVTPMGDSLRLAGTLELAGSDRTLAPRRVRAVHAAGRAYLGAATDGDTVEVWSGLRALSGDGLPIIGRMPRAPWITIATGHGHVGVGMSAGTGALLGALLLDRDPPIDPAPYDPGRFMVLGARRQRSRR